MGSITTVLRLEVLLFLGALAFIVAYQLLTGRIGMRRLLFAKGRDPAGTSQRRTSRGLSPSRVQLLVISLGVAIYLLAEVLRDPDHFSEIPTGLLWLMAGSQTVYLARKAYNLLLRRSIRRSIHSRSR